jgi:hypothetical protein
MTPSEQQPPVKKDRPESHPIKASTNFIYLFEQLNDTRTKGHFGGIPRVVVVRTQAWLYLLWIQIDVTA